MKIFKYLVLVLSLVIFGGGIVSAQEASSDSVVYGWAKEIIGNLNLTQASFDNWQQGGESTLAWQVKLDADFTQDEEKFNWANTGRFNLGFAKIAGNEARKAADEISLESVYTRKLGKLLNPFAAVTGKTQFVSGFNYGENSKTKVSRFLDPAYFTQSVGVGYAPNKQFKTRIGATLKETITSDFPVPYADDPTTAKIEKTRIEPGISSVTDFKRKFHDNIIYTTKLDIFSDLKAVDRIDVLWRNNLNMKVTKYINVSFDVELLYDKDISSDRQLKQVLSLGLSYTFL